MGTASKLMMNLAAFAFVTVPAFGMSSGSPDADSPGAEEDVSIGVSKSQESKQAFIDKASPILKKFLSASDTLVDTRAQKANVDALLKDYHSQEILCKSLDPRNMPDASLRKAALSALDLAKYTGEDVSHGIFASSVSDPDESVRKAAVQSIRLRRDGPAIKKLVDYYIATYDDAGNVKLGDAHDNAIEGLRTLAGDDKAVYEVLRDKAYYATIETRVTNTELVRFQTRQIDSFSVNAGAQVNIILQLSFPIQFPELAITRVRTTVKCPCVSALEDLAGQNFGPDIDKWDKWIRKQ